MSWAGKRQFKYLMIVLGFFIVIVFLFTYKIIFRKPTCFDGKQNGQELGLDCGGSCSLFCSSEVSLPVTLWSRAFPVTENIYNLVALVENQNKNAAVEEIFYEFRVYDDSNLLIGRRQGSTYLPPNQQFVILEPRFDGAESQVKSVTFDFSPSYSWIKKNPILQTFPVYIKDIELENYDTLPTLRARVTNESIYDLPEFDVAVVLYDENYNAINASKTYKSGLKSNEETQVFFSWNKPFQNKPATQDILIEVNPFSVSF